LSLVALENLKEGWELSADVRDVNGRLVLSKGQKIDQNHIRIFKIWGIPEVSVKQKHEQALSEQRPADIEKLFKVEQTLKMILRHVDLKHAGINAIYKAAAKYRSQKDLIRIIEPEQPLPQNFKLDLSSGLRTQIEFTELQLPETPEIIIEFSEVADDPRSSANDIAEVISRSPSLASQLLKVANSAFYGFVSKIDTISRALTLIGIKEIRSLVMGIVIMRLFHSISKELVDMSSFLRHSLACGILSRILAAQKRLPHPERLFTAGLLHDLGRLAWYHYFPEQAKLILLMARKTGLSLYDIEKECLGISHEQIAGYLLQKWHLPASLASIIVHHHTPSRSTAPAETAIVHMADLAINTIGLGHSGEHIIARFESNTWDRLQIAPVVLKIAIEQTMEQVDIMETIFVKT
jgi:putative nucleotidyltransferase with HDIG domain